MPWIYFKPEEVVGLDEGLVTRLDAARGIAGVPFRITEGLGSGGAHVGNTAHARGLAVDLACVLSGKRMRMVRGLLQAGFRRIGIYDKHIHADIDKTLPQDVMWWGVSK